MRFIFSVFILLQFVISSCTNPARQDQPNVYYDVLGFVKQQIADLSVRKPLVRKAVSINDTRSQQHTREINWSRELALFTQADINKPALRTSYQITRPDSLTYQYTLKNSADQLTVQSLIVQVDSVTHQPRRIEAFLQTSNPLYSSERNLLLESGPTGGQWRVNHYRLSGFQKLPYFDKNSFLVEGQVN
ncbi:hypothetical protein [Spirosoma spitsbergense]|uniref:hypothetical protein n=1 Tax=Spirosoma spitsbergense TaxID=431554 RepID=UPI0003609075|nr:hypothetical protein [Spirosoma spitsbergense]